MAEECATVYVCHGMTNDDDVMADQMDTRSVYTVFSRYLHNANKQDNHVRGYIDGEDSFKYFLEEFSDVCKSKFTTRTSWKKGGSDNRTKGRYGREERLYWEYKSGNVTLPFTGVPFIVKSCLTKHCQFGHHYYKTTDERYQKQLEMSMVDPTIEPPKEKKRRMKQTKKRECPAKMHIREIVMFEQFALPKSPKKSLKLLKASRLSALRKALASEEMHDKSKLNCTQRFYVQVPLPQVHQSHPESCGGFPSQINSYISKKIDDCLRVELYDAEKVYWAVKKDAERELFARYPDDKDTVDLYLLHNFPSENDIAEYIYINAIESKPTVIVEKDLPDNHDGDEGTTSTMLAIADVGTNAFDSLESIGMFAEEDGGSLTFLTKDPNPHDDDDDDDKRPSCVSVDVITPLTFVHDKSPLPRHKHDIIEPSQMLNDITVKIEEDDEEEEEASMHGIKRSTQLLDDSGSQLDITEMSEENGQKIFYSDSMLDYTYTNSDLVYE